MDNEGTNKTEKDSVDRDSSTSNGYVWVRLTSVPRGHIFKTYDGNILIKLRNPEVAPLENINDKEVWGADIGNGEVHRLTPYQNVELIGDAYEIIFKTLNHNECGEECKKTGHRCNSSLLNGVQSSDKLSHTPLTYEKGCIQIDRIREAAMHNSLLNAIIKTGEQNFEPWEEIMKKAVLLLIAENNRLKNELIKIYQKTGNPITNINRK